MSGASAGIGKAICVLLVKHGLQVIGTARREEKLKELENELKNESGKFFPYKCDMGKNEEIQNLFVWIKEQFGKIHILINNAAITNLGTICDSPLETIMPVLEVNLLGVIYTTKEAITLMKETKVDGHVIFMNSIAGHYVYDVFSFSNNYAVAKYGMKGLNEVIRKELISAGSKIKVSSISPGPVDTELVERDPNHTEARELWKKIPLLTSEDVANAVVYILATPPHVQIHELIIRPVGEIM